MGYSENFVDDYPRRNKKMMCNESVTKESTFIFNGNTYQGDCISVILFNGKNIIRPWGVEFADSSAFYSLEEGFGYRYEIVKEERERTKDCFRLRQIIKMREGCVLLELEDQFISGSEIRRISKLTCLQPTILMDFVLRFRFNAEVFPIGYIAGRKLSYQGQGIYQQYPVRDACVCSENYSIKVSINDSIMHEYMSGFMYLNDISNSWVLHVRMLPHKWDKEVVKLCSRWFRTKPIPNWIGAPLLSIGGIKKALWYRGERDPYRNRLISIFSPNAYPLVKLEKGAVLMWDASCVLSHHITPNQ